MVLGVTAKRRASAITSHVVFCGSLYGCGSETENQPHAPDIALSRKNDSLTRSRQTREEGPPSAAPARTMRCPPSFGIEGAGRPMAGLGVRLSLRGQWGGERNEAFIEAGRA